MSNGGPADPARFENEVLDVQGREVDARVCAPTAPRAASVWLHGAGSNLATPLLEGFTAALGRRGVASLRCNFPYRQAGSRRPDPRPVLFATVAAACSRARQRWPGLPLYAGGHSMGGRMTSEAEAAGALGAVAGVAFLAFPLAGKAAVRTEHLRRTTVPRWFAHGTRDRLGALAEIEALVLQLGTNATLHVLDTGDHSLDVLRRSGRTAQQVHGELADAFVAWTEELGASRQPGS